MSSSRKTLKWVILVTLLIVGCVVVVLVLPWLQELSLASKAHMAIYGEGVYFTGSWVDGRVEYSLFDANCGYGSEMPDAWIEVMGEIRQVSEISLEDLERWNAIPKEATSGAQYWKASFCDAALWACELDVRFENERLASVGQTYRSGTDCECPIRVSLDGDKWVQLPVTEDELVESLGPPKRFSRRRIHH